MAFIHDLFDLVRNEDFIYIQTHDFPDHDAVASAFGLRQLLKSQGTSSYLTFVGTVQTDSLLRMIRLLEIPIREAAKEPLRPFDKIIIVDGRKGSPKVTDLTGEEIAVIDHHTALPPEGVRLVDVRAEYGACATIIHSYYEELGIEPVPKLVPTASALWLQVLVFGAIAWAAFRRTLRTI